MIAQRTPARFHCPIWPGCDCPDGSVDPNCPGLETLTIPPGNRKAMVCQDYPDCGCEGDCELPPLRAACAPERIIALILAGCAVLGSILIWLAVR